MAGLQPSDFVTVGQIGAAYGVKGWVKLVSFTGPTKNILSYSSFTVLNGTSLHKIEIEQSRSQGKGFVAHIKGCDDRDRTRDYTGKELLIEKSILPQLNQSDYYWYQLEGLKVINRENEDLGKVHHLIETGANDVLVVQASTESIDDEERLIPYLSGQVIENVDLEEQLIRVNWEKDF